jgi:hypothetical protein
MTRLGAAAGPVTMALAAALVAGCDAGVATVPVSGRVTLNNQPLAGATVTFQPVRAVEGAEPVGPGSVGRTNAEGRYELRLIEPDRPGAVMGRHVVTITTAEAGTDDGQLPTGEQVPPAWRNGSRTFVVPAGGTQSADFELAE